MTNKDELQVRISARLQLHWPDIRLERMDDDRAVLRAQIADDTWLELLLPKRPHDPWTASPTLKRESTYEPYPNMHTYGIGVNLDSDAELVADRFYEEVRFWWMEYEAVATRRS